MITLAYSPIRHRMDALTGYCVRLKKKVAWFCQRRSIRVLGSRCWPSRNRRYVRPAWPGGGGPTRPSLPPIQGALTVFFHAHMRLTEKGSLAQAAYNPLSFDNPASRCIGPPAPALIIYTNLYPLEIQINEEEETVVFRTEYFDELRTVYLDGRDHPEDGTLFPGGHSIGWWEGDVLVVDSQLFTAHRSPYQIGVPSGTQKHLVERYRLIEDGARILVEFTLEDPDYMTEPLTHERELIYSPDVEMVSFDCNQESTERFVPG